MPSNNASRAPAAENRGDEPESGSRPRAVFVPAGVKGNVPATGESRGRLLTIAQVAGVVVMGWLVWSDAVLPRLRWESAADLASEALFYVMLAWMVAAFIACAMYFTVSLADMPEAFRFSLRSTAPAMWFAPAVILASLPLPAAFLVSAVLVAHAARQLMARWWAPAALGYATVKPANAMLASGAAQLGLVAELWNHPLAAAALLAAAAAMVTSLAIATGAYQPVREPVLPPSFLSIAVVFLLAVTVSYGGLRARFAGGRGSGAGVPPGAQQVTQVAEPPDGSLAPDGDFPGVILLPELKPQATLLIPPPIQPGLLNAPLSKPVGIPFSGEYWMFRWPNQRPPARSYVRRGTPTELSFHTTDGWPIQMEAYQRLDPPADPRCCRAIQLVIANGETATSAVSLQVVLIDSRTRARASLGDVNVEPGRFEQMLTYSMTNAANLHTFDEIKIIFHRNDGRMDKSSKVALERFVLLP